jgi:uncharacterized protein YabN with tetrapyrrole methylase and pyrophosphatase domain
MSDMLDKPSHPEPSPYDIYIVGTGIIPAFHLTRESENAIRASKEVLYVDRSFGIKEFLCQLSSNVTDLAELSYQEGTERLNSYTFMASKVIEAALDHPPVTFALYGHPLIYSLPPFIVKAAAEALGLRVKTMAGVSSLDTIFIDLNIDPCTQGLQMYEATDLLLRQRPIQADVPCIIWQVGTVESRLYTEHANAPGRFSAFQDYLLKFYPEDTIIKAVYSSSIPLVPASIRDFSILEFEVVSEFLHQGVTLYIHPPESRAIRDENLKSTMDKLSHLRDITAPASH